MPIASPSGFYNASTTKFLMLFVGASSLLAAIFNQKPFFHLQLHPHITIHHQFWRLLTSHCAFTNSGELFFGLLLLYTMRVIERQYGYAKYTAFVFLSLVMSTLLELGALVSGARLGLRSIPGGPYALLFSMMYQYHRLIPVTYRFRIFGFTMSSKMFTYALALQIFASQGFATMTPCVCGLLAGALYRSDIMGIKQWRFPRLMRSAAHHYIAPSLASAPIARSTNTLPNETSGVSNALETLATTGLRNRRQPVATAARANTSTVREYIDTFTSEGSDLEPPSEEDTVILRTMFPDHPPESITRALSSAHNNLNRAVEIMLSTPAPSSSSGSGPQR
ncbi:hypothetical protein BCR43DRAFT_139697 [Syncephalastrum racemosum]|uniref:CUE domain-containing protein n=1 Tax=Syncephalastrum racemosum TaxID=13706 RepID=A0A1X2HLX9_SYNRA|nr:hypothetical protein BCR43DRAFT_139697 [Syncephalastrum racemosum]